MLLKFFGGAQEVGRSSIMIKDGKTLMLDYGIKLNSKTEYPIGLPHIDAVVLSHAHLDHSGFLPAIYNEMLVPTFGTPPTLKLSTLLLEDSLNITKKEHQQPRFHKRQIKSFVNRYVNLDYHSNISVGDFNIQLFDAGHICGSAITLLERKNSQNNKRIVYTGDYKLEQQYLHDGSEIVESDVLIMESTYATKEHPDREKLIQDFVGGVREVLDNGGTALVPAFAVGRAQESLAILYRNKLTTSTFVDGMARTATSIVLKYPDFIQHGDVLAKAVEETMSIDNHKDRRDAMVEPSVILTTAGMLNGGPVLNYITKLNRKSRIFLTGFQVEGSNGRMLLEKGAIMLSNKSVKIDTETSYYDFSAHAGKNDLHEYAKRSSPSTIVCVHGSEENTKALAEDLKREGFQAYAPKVGDTIKLD